MRPADVLPDCSRCGGRVVLDTDEEGPTERCVGCGLEQKPVPVWTRAEVRRRVSIVHAAAVRGEL